VDAEVAPRPTELSFRSRIQTIQKIIEKELRSKNGAKISPGPLETAFGAWDLYDDIALRHWDHEPSQI
jgi:hypothetical protein